MEKRTGSANNIADVETHKNRYITRGREVLRLTGLAKNTITIRKKEDSLIVVRLSDYWEKLPKIWNTIYMTDLEIDTRTKKKDNRILPNISEIE